MLRYGSVVLSLVTLGACSYKSQAIAVNLGAQSQLTASDTNPVADGVDDVTVTLSLKHTDGSAATGLSVRMAIDSNDVLVVGGSAIDANTALTTDAQGQVKANLTSPHAGTKNISTVLVTDSQVISLRSVAITFRAPTVFPSLSLSINASPIAGVPFSVTARVADSNGKLATGYLGTLNLVCTDANAVLPAQATFSASDQGQKVISGFAFHAAGTTTLTATDTQLPSLTQSLGIAVNPGPLSGFHMVVGNAVAGQAADLTITAVDAYDNIVPTFTGDVQVTAADPNDTNGAPALSGNITVTFALSDHGQVTVPGAVTLDRISNQVSLTATGQDPNGNAVSSTVSNFNVVPGPADHLQLALGATHINSGDSTSATVTVQDAYGNTVPTYAGSVSFGGTDPRATLPSVYGFNPNTDLGTHGFSVTLRSVSPNTVVTVRDTVNAKPSAGNANIAVAAIGPYLTAAWPANAHGVSVAGTPQTLTITARDMSGATLTTYNGTVNLHATDPQALQGTVTLSNGTGQASNVVLVTAGTQYVVLTDTQDATMAGSSDPLLVQPGNANALVLNANNTTVAGVANPVSVTAIDPYGNTATGYAGTIHVTSSDAAASLPGDHTFTNTEAGITQLSVTLKTSGLDTVVATDTSTASITGHTNITVGPATPSGFGVQLNPNHTTAGVAVDAKLTARDAYGNTTPSYTGTVTWQTDNANAVLPPATTFASTNAGVVTLPGALTFYTAASSSSVAVSDGTLTGSTTVKVTAAGASKLLLTGPSSRAMAGVPFAVHLSETDDFGNLATGLRAVHWSTSDANSNGLPDNGNSLFLGQQDFNVTLFQAGLPTLTASNPTGTLAASSIVVPMAPAGAQGLSITGLAVSNVAGQPLSFTVNAVDAFGNSATSYTGTVQLTATDSAFALTDYTFLSSDVGSKTFASPAFNLTMHTAGDQNIVAQDLVASALKVTARTKIVADVAASFAVTGLLSNPNAGLVQNCNVTALDQYSNRATSYAGTVTLSSSDAHAVLPGPATFDPTGDKGSHQFVGVSLHTAGLQSLTASDVNGLSGNFNSTVQPATAAMLSFSGTPANANAGVAFDATVSALDAYGNMATSYSGSVSFTTTPDASNGNAVLPGSTAFAGGTHTFAHGFTLNVAPSMQLNASGTSPGINGNIVMAVAPGDANRFVVSGISSTLVAGSPNTVNVRVYDNYNNLTPYTGTVAFNSNDTNPNTLLPSNYTFVATENGNHTFTNGVVLTTAQTSFVQATDTTRSALTGKQSGIVVGAAATQSLVVSGYPNPQIAGNSNSFRVTARDAYGNASSFLGFVSFSSDDANAVVPSSTPVFNSGTVSGMIFKTAGSHDIDCSATSVGHVPQTVTVMANPNIDHLAMTTPTTAFTCAPLAPAVQVSVFDQYNNVITQNGNSVMVTAQNGNIFGTTVQPVQNGNAVFNDLSLDTSGANGLLATLGSFSASDAFAVTGGNNTPSIVLSAPSTTSACADFNITVGTCGAPVDVTLQVQTASGTAPMTLASSSPYGLYGINAKKALSYVWDTSRDISSSGTTDANIIITAKRSSGTGSNTVSQHLTVSNQAAFRYQGSWTATAPLLNAAVSGDFDHDGVSELVVTDGNHIYVSHVPGGGSSRSVLAGTVVQSMAAGDVNGDSNLDVAACAANSGGGHSVVVYLGNGDGTLASGVVNTGLSDCLDVALADVDHNGVVDAIVQDANGQGLMWAPAYHTGSVASINVEFPLGFRPSNGLVAADFTGDGNVDILVGASTGLLGLAVGNGSGFASVVTTTPGGNPPWALAAADIDNNGHMDAVVGDDSTLVAYTNLTATSFNIGVTNALSGISTTRLVLADVDGDGAVDAVSGTNLGLLVYKGHGTGGFPSAQVITAQNPNGLVIMDWDHDGAPDLGVTSAANAGVWSNSTPRSCDPTLFAGVISSPTAPTPIGMAVADFTNDGKYDVVVSHGATAPNKGELFAGDGRTAVRLRSSYALGGPAYGPPAAGDLNGDGYPDVALPVPASNYVSVYTGDANGNLTAQGNYMVTPSNTPSAVAVTDWDRDGHNDLLVVTADTNVLTVMLGPSFTTATQMTTTVTAKGLAVGALTASGYNDVVLWSNTALFVGINGGSTSGFASSATYSGGGALVQAIIADENFDGFADLVYTDASGAGTVYVRGGNGTGVLGGSNPFDPFCTPGGIAMADFDGANGLDLAILCTSQPTGVAVAYNKGRDGEARSTFVPLGALPIAIAARDMTSDGHMDMVALTENSNTVEVIINNGFTGGSSNFYGGLFLNNFANACGVASADFTRDGIADVAMGTSNGSAVSLRAGTASSFGTITPVSAGSNPNVLVQGDLDNNGATDLVIANTGATSLTVIKNLTQQGGSFSLAAAVTVPLTAPATALALADMDHDGLLDIVSGSGSGVSINYGSALLTQTTSGPSNNVTALAVGDVNLDGYIDVVTLDGPGNALNVFHNTSGTVPGIDQSFALSGGPVALALGDINNDGYLDIVMVLGSAGTTQVASLMNNRGTFAGLVGTIDTNLAPPPGAAAATSLVLVDLDHDGWLDVVVPTPHNYGALLLRNGGNAPFFSLTPWMVNLGTAMRNVAVDDQNHDGRWDLVLIDDVDQIMDVAPGR